MSLSPDQIERLARLARIALGPAEEAAVVGQLNRVLGLIDQMRAVDTAGIEPMSHPVDVAQRQRPDLVTETDQHELFQADAPAVEAGLYLVPRVLE
ncbi:MAG: Asp-tRNA(Asn)/Glu-tRNA(Gln) amidotransferase subunit GatC [Burkholderiales bacterium]